MYFANGEIKGSCVIPQNCYDVKIDVSGLYFATICDKSILIFEIFTGKLVSEI